MRKPVTNEYVQGVEVEVDYAGLVPNGFDIINLPEATYLLFRGEPFAEENFETAIAEIWNAEKKYPPSRLNNIQACIREIVNKEIIYI